MHLITYKYIYDNRAGHEDHQPWGAENCVGNQELCNLPDICYDICIRDRNGSKPVGLSFTWEKGRGKEAAGYV